MLKLGSIDLKQLKIESVYRAYFAMGPREQTFALVGAVLALLLVIVLPVTVASSRIGRIEREVEQGKKQFREVMRSIDSYNAKRASLSGLQQALSGGFDTSLSTTIESLAEKHGMKEKIDSLKAKSTPPSDVFEEQAVDVSIKRVSLEPLINFIFDIENDPDKVLRLKTLSMKPRYDNKQEMDASMTVSTYRLLEGATEGL
ncbi:MAG: hypothetical protein JXA24_01545 [Proteobacteria bacterium]|nr:hypothetical protein [Pseudomonadota bacterium]